MQKLNLCGKNKFRLISKLKLVDKKLSQVGTYVMVG